MREQGAGAAPSTPAADEQAPPDGVTGGRMLTTAPPVGGTTRLPSSDAALPHAPALPGMSAARQCLFFGTYLLYIVVNTVNGPLMPAMKVGIGFSSGAGATIAAVQTVGISAGKLLWGGWPVDACGARRTYMWTMALVGVLAFSYSSAHDADAVAAIAFLVEFFSTPAYPAHVQLVRGWMPPASTAVGFYLLGISSRTGDVLAKLGYGQLLKIVDWRQATWVACAIGLGAAALGGALHADSPTRRDVQSVRLAPRELRAILARILSSGHFWLAASALSGTCVVKRAIELLGALYFFDTSANLSQADAASLAMVWSAGLALSVLCGGPLFTRLRPRGKSALVGCLLSLSVFGCAALSRLSATEAVTNADVALRAGMIFVTAIGIGLPYYVPPGMFAVSFGARNSGTVSAYLDTVAFAVSGASIACLRPVLDGSEHGWAMVWAILTAVAVAALLLQLVFLRALLHRGDEQQELYRGDTYRSSAGPVDE